MGKLLKIFFIILGFFILGLYSCFLFVIPRVTDANKYKPEIQKAVKENINLNIDFSEPKVSVSPLLSVGIKADNFVIRLNDGSDFITSKTFEGRISLPSLFFRKIKISKLKIENPVINIDIVNGKAFKAVNDYEELLGKKEQNMEQSDAAELKTEAETSFFDLSKFKIAIPNINLTDYVLNINDLKTSEYIKLKGEELKAGYYHGERAAIKTEAELFLNEGKQINAKIDIDTMLHSLTKLDKEDDKAQRINITFINPVAVYKAYNLKADINAKLKIRKKNNRYISKGFVNIDKFTVMLSGLQLPESFLHLKSDGRKTEIDTDFFVTGEEEIHVSGNINCSKKPAFDIKLKTTEIHTENVLKLVKVTLDSLHIRHELKHIKGFGSVNADVFIKTDFKKLKSDGFININNLAIKNSVANDSLFRLNSYISLEKNILNIQNTFAEIAQTIINIHGSIDSKSLTDININIEKLPLERIFELFFQEETKNIYKVNSGNINVDASIKGEMKKAPASLNLTMKDVSITDKKNNITYINKLLKAVFIRTTKNLTGKINNEGFQTERNGVKAVCDNFDFIIGEKDLEAVPGKIRINNSTEIYFGGIIKNYAKNPLISVYADGFIRTSDIKQFIGKDLAEYFDNRGMLPVSVSLNGNNKKQKFEFRTKADAENYITPIKTENLEKKNTLFQVEADLKGDRMKIKNTGIYIVQSVADEKNPEKQVEKLTEIFGINGTVTKLNTNNPNINIIKFKMPQELRGNIFIFPESEFKAKGHAFLFGGMQNPQLRGKFDISGIKIPEIMTAIDRISAKFEGKEIYTEIKNADVNGSDYNLLINTDINPVEIFTIKNLKLSSEYTDIDKLTLVAEAITKYLPQNIDENKEPADIPCIIKSGTANITKIKSGDIILGDTISNIMLKDNVLVLTDILTSVFQGKVRGSTGINLLTNEIKASLNGTGLDTEETLFYGAGLKDTLTGTLDFDTNITFEGTSDEEILKSLKGVLNFTMKNGQTGPFTKLENLIMAENIRESTFFQTTIGSIINSALTFDTARYKDLTGHLLFENGVAKINSITSKGEVMSTYITGSYNLFKNNIDIVFRGRLGSMVSDALGPLAMLNPVNLLKATPGMSIIAGKVFFLFTEGVTPEELKQIPDLSSNIADYNTTKFQVIVKGDVNKPLTLVKSFKWLALQGDIDRAKDYAAKNEAEEAKKAEEEKSSQTQIKGDTEEKAFFPDIPTKGFFEKIKSVFNGNKGK